MSAKKNDPTSSLDLSTAKAAFAKVLPRLEKLPGDSLSDARTDVQSAAVFAMGVAREIAAPETRARFASLPKAAFDLAHVDELEQVALAAWHARTAVAAASAGVSDAKLSAALVDEATSVKTRMLRLASYYLASYYLADDPKRGPEVADIRSGSGHQDLATDLVRLADLYDAEATTLAHDTKHYRASDPKDARKAARSILDALSLSQNADYRKSVDLSARAWTHLATTYAEVRAAGLFLFRSEGAEARFPSLVAAGRARAKQAATPVATTPDEAVV